MTERYGAGAHANIPHAAYHADCCPEPSVSAGLLHMMLSRSPAHVRWSHPRLHPATRAPDHSHRMSNGSVLHALLLGTGTDIVEIDAENFKTKAAQQARDAAIESGKTPVCAPQLLELRGIVGDIWDKLDNHEMFRGLHERPPGIPEATMIWQDDGSWCRARADWLSRDVPLMVDFKFTERGALGWAAGADARGDDVRAAHYIRGYNCAVGRFDPQTGEQLFDITARYLFVVIERNPPYELCVHELDGEALSIGERKRERALSLWRDCLRCGCWPGYPEQINRVSLKPWQVTDWEMREQFEEAFS